MPPRIIIIAGEASGDLHAANLAREIKNLRPDVQLSGWGGETMRRFGVEIYYPLTKLAVVGFAEVLKNYQKFKRVFDSILEKIDEIKPQAVVLVDYPGFNLRLARQIKKRNIPIIYYISPQVWAWGKKRLRLIKRVVDKMLVVFRFEQKLYRDAGIPCVFVGHPLLDIARPTMPIKECLRQWKIDPGRPRLAILPGSRNKEVQRLLPIMLRAAKIISEEKIGLQIIILRSSSVPEDIFKEISKNFSLRTRLITEKTYDGLNICDFAIVASGTATLDTAIMQRPFVITYRISTISYFVLKSLIKIKSIGLVNIVAQKRIIPELLQKNAHPQKIAREVLGIWRNPKRMAEIKQDLARIKSLLTPYGASQAAAKETLSLI
ncbi:MAG: lipid-A-disaccharide synthase [Candidatus Omnitrophota bacterium]